MYGMADGADKAGARAATLPRRRAGRAGWHSAAMPGCAEPLPVNAEPAPTDLIVTRHPGAADWVRRVLGRPVRCVAHLEVHELRPGMRYHGVFPLDLAAAICAAGSECWAISLRVPAALRGQELTAAQLDQLGARLVRYTVRADDAGPLP